MEADNLKKATRNMGNSVYRALCEVTSITAPPGVNRRAKSNEGDNKFMWNGRGFHNLSVLIDAIKAHDPQLIRAAHDIFAARAGTRRPVGRPPKPPAGMPPAPAPAPALAPAPMQVVDFAGAVRGTIAAKIQALTAYLGALEGRNGTAIAASPFCPPALAVPANPEIDDLEAILAIPSLSASTRAASANRLAELRANQQATPDDAGIDAEIERVRALIATCETVRSVF
jgi:hypothetical protein